MLQLGCQLILAYWALRNDGIQGCQFSIPGITSYIAYALAIINLIAVIAIRCSAGFPRCLFFAVFTIDLLAAIAIIAINAVKGFGNCAASKTFYHFSIIESGITIFVCFVVLFMRLAWSQRYSNSPGNLVWPAMFLPFYWTDNFRIYMQIIGIVTAIISVVTFLVNLSTLLKTSTSTRKIVTFGWIFGLILLFLLQALAAYKYLAAGNSLTDYEDVHAKKTLAVFIAVNAIDILFWLWGMKTLDYQKGDHVRDSLFFGKDDFTRTSNINNLQPVDKSIVVPTNIGTINR